ncbi:hypothetical protein [Comamonas sp. C24C]
MLTSQFVLALPANLVIDLFADGGGASTGIEQAIASRVDIAIIQDVDAIDCMMHITHVTRHYRTEIEEVCPYKATDRQPGPLHATTTEDGNPTRSTFSLS